MVSSPNLKIVPTHQGWTLNFAIANSIDQCQLAATHLSCHHGKNATRRRTALRSSRQAALSRSSPQLQLGFGMVQMDNGPGNRIGPRVGPGLLLQITLLDGTATHEVSLRKSSVQLSVTRAQTAQSKNLEPKHVGNMHVSNLKHFTLQCSSRPLAREEPYCGNALTSISMQQKLYSNLTYLTLDHLTLNLLTPTQRAKAARRND